jgi:bifunctional DNase/RNase
MELARVIINEQSQSQVIFLREVNGSRMFPIVIGIFEAAAIDQKLRNIENPRPLTHDLIRNILNGLDVGLERIVVTDLKNNTFLAKLVISQNGTEVEIDARPSDSIALAITMNSPIYVNERVLDKVKNV